MDGWVGAEYLTSSHAGDPRALLPFQTDIARHFGRRPMVAPNGLSNCLE